MKKIFLLFLAMTSLHVFSQNVMVVEHQDGKIERYSTQDVNNVGIRFTGDKSTNSFYVQNKNGVENNYFTNLIRTISFEPFLPETPSLKRPKEYAPTLIISTSGNAMDCLLL